MVKAPNRGDNSNFCAAATSSANASPLSVENVENNEKIFNDNVKVEVVESLENTEPAPEPEVDPTHDEISSDNVKVGAVESLENIEPAPQPEVDPTLVLTPRKFVIGFGNASMVLVRAITNVASAVFTYAYYIQATALLNPFITAMLARVFLGEKRLPPLFIVAFLGSAVGAGLAIYGEHAAKEEDPSFSSEGPQHVPTLMDTAIGITLQFVSVCFSSMNGVAIKMTQRENISTQHLAAFQFGFGSLLLAFYITIFDPEQWFALWVVFRSGGFNLGLMIYFSLAIMFFGSSVEMVVVREIGPVIHSSFQPTRMIPALIGTYLLLHEPVRSGLTWAGLGVLLLSLTLYFHAQLKK